MHCIQLVINFFVRTVFLIYKKALSPLIGQSCRFHPPCSDYAAEAIQRHGIVHGGWLSLRRVCKCHPYCEGGFDYVPELNS